MEGDFHVRKDLEIPDHIRQIVRVLNIHGPCRRSYADSGQKKIRIFKMYSFKLNKDSENMQKPLTL